MTLPQTYLQTGWGDSVDDVDMEDISWAISETIEMDNEQGLFWVGIFVGLSELILEVKKDLTVTGIFNDNEDENVKAQFSNWIEIEDLYKIFLDKDFDQVQALIRARN